MHNCSGDEYDKGHRHTYSALEARGSRAMHTGTRTHRHHKLKNTIRLHRQGHSPSSVRFFLIFKKPITSSPLRMNARARIHAHTTVPGNFCTQEECAECLRGRFRKATVAQKMELCTYSKSSTVAGIDIRIIAMPSSPMSLPSRFSSVSAEHCPSTPARLPAPS